MATSLGVWLALQADDRVLAWACAAIGGMAGLVLLLGLVVRVPATVPAGLALLGSGYALLLALEDTPLDLRAAAVAAGLLAIAELAYWSLELRADVTDEPGSHARRFAAVALLSLGALAVSGGLLALVDVAGREGVAVEIVGACAALAALLLLLGLTRSTAT
jgi:hypothetical protein